LRPGDLNIQLAGESLILLPERAVYWPRKQTLLVADTHWGKAATLRAAAIPIPGGTTTADLARLTDILNSTRAARLVLLGDAIHAREGRAARTLRAVAEWRESHPKLDILLVRGNHDRRSGDPPAELNISCANAPVAEPPFVFQHYPGASAEGYALAGHLHPAIRLHGRGKQKATLVCFWFAPEFGVLPSFGSLTGSAFVERGLGDRVYGIAEDEVISV
jgi:DNA ligase-associated metallophosphoesterase